MDPMPFTLQFPGNGKVVGADVVKVIRDLWGLSFSSLIVLWLVVWLGIGR